MIETLPEVRPVPAEPTTPIKPSEAIRLGCLTTLPMSGGWGHGDYACVNRALFLGLYGGDDEWTRYTEIDRLMRVEPPCGWNCSRSDGLFRDDDHRTASWVLIHLNDEHEWSRERIADWLAERGL